MSDLSALPGEAPASGAGALLRAARQKQGLHIAALAASIKVTPSKLEALEAGRYEELPDATFTRALAQSVCRVLKIDAQPVLAQLPSTRDATLDNVRVGLNTPFRERPGRIDPVDWALWRQPVFWLVLLMLAAAVAFMMVPGQWLQRWTPAAGPSADASSPAAVELLPPPATAASSVVETVRTPMSESQAASAPAAAAQPQTLAVAIPASAPAPVAAASASALAPNVTGTRVRGIQATWVQASDAKGQLLISRTVAAGEVVDLDGPRPLRVRIGNVHGTELQHRGQVVDLASRTQNNVATIELP